MKVYTVYWKGMPEEKVSIEAESAGKAKYICYKMVLSAHYENVCITQFVAHIDSSAKPSNATSPNTHRPVPKRPKGQSPKPCPECGGHGKIVVDNKRTGLTEFKPCPRCK